MASTPPTPAAADADSIAMLTAMGFERSKAVEALTVCDGNLEQAAEYLLGGGGGASDGGAVPASASSHSTPRTDADTSSETVYGSISQYNQGGGQSACTCIALTATERFLSGPKPKGTVGPPLIDAKWLDETVTAGVASYQQLMQKGSGAVEHLSAEEVLQANLFPALQIEGGNIRQGVLSADNPQGLRQLLAECRSSSDWSCVLMTKTPETVLLCMQPADFDDKDYGFWLVDSHPRPQFAAQGGCYARKHKSLEDLVASLQTIFPFTDLGSDVPEMMAVMYNSFDLYPLQLKSSPPPT